MNWQNDFLTSFEHITYCCLILKNINSCENHEAINLHFISISVAISSHHFSNNKWFNLCFQNKQSKNKQPQLLRTEFWVGAQEVQSNVACSFLVHISSLSDGLPHGVIMPWSLQRRHRKELVEQTQSPLIQLAFCHACYHLYV